MLSSVILALSMASIEMLCFAYNHDETFVDQNIDYL